MTIHSWLGVTMFIVALAVVGVLYAKAFQGTFSERNVPASEKIFAVFTGALAVVVFGIWALAIWGSALAHYMF